MLTIVGPPTYPAPIQQIFTAGFMAAIAGNGKVSMIKSSEDTYEVISHKKTKSLSFSAHGKLFCWVMRTGTGSAYV